MKFSAADETETVRSERPGGQKAAFPEQTLIGWWRRMRSFSGLCCFLPGLGGIFFVYWAHARGLDRLLLAKSLHEALALGLTGVAAALFLVRAWRCRLEIDYLLLVMAVNFLCREIHFAGTDQAVVVVAAGVLAMSIYWRKRLLATLREAPLVQLALTGTAFSYLLALLIQRRVFKAGRIPLLPDEALLHVPLEEVAENIAHAFFIFIALAAFRQLGAGRDVAGKK